MLYGQDKDILKLISSIISYLRKSRQDVVREKRTGEDTLTEQELLMTKVLKDYEIPYDMRKEIGSGDKIETRPVFQQILRELREKKWDAIAVKEISRLGRGSYSDMGQIFDLIVDNRIFIITPYKIYDPDNPADRRQIRFEIFLSREEFETTRERLTGARYNYAMQGRWMAGSSIPYGYKLNAETTRLEPDEETSKNIKLIFNLYVNGLNGREMSFRAISTYLKRIGIKTAKGKDHWSPQTISRMVQNPVYIGQERYRMSKFVNGKREFRPEDEWIVMNDAHEPIIEEDLWLEAQKKFKTSSNNPRVKLDFSPCELASLVVCSKCGRKMVRQYSVQNYKKKNGEMTKYHKEFLWCTETGCTMVKYRDVENLILRFLEGLKSFDRDILIDTLNKATQDSINSNQSEIEMLKQSIQDKEKELKGRLSFIRDKYESGIYSDEEFVERRAKINKELEDLKRVELPKENIEDRFEIDIEELTKRIDTILDVYNSLENKSDKNVLLRQIFDRIELTVLEKGKGRKPAKIKIKPILKVSFLV